VQHHRSCNPGMKKPVSWKQKRVLVTGATGFIGRHLVARLREMDAQVYAATSPANEPTSSTPAIESAGKPTARSLTFDIRDDKVVREALRGAAPDVVFHLAAIGVTNPDVDPRLALMVNAGGAINLLEASKEIGVDRVVLVGTSYEYGARGTAKTLDPFNSYAASKVAAWAFGRMYWRAYELPVVIVRPFQVYGPGQPNHLLIPAAMRAAILGDDFRMTPGEQKRDFVFAEDVANGMIAAAVAAGIEGTSLDLGTGRGTAVWRVVEQIWKLAEAEGSVQRGARPYRTGAAMHLVADADRTARLISWRATTPLEEGLQITMKQLEAQVR